MHAWTEECQAARGIDLPAVWKGTQPGTCRGQLAFVRGAQLSLPAVRCYLSLACLTEGTARQQSSHLEQVPELVRLHVCIGLLLRVRSHAVGRRDAIAQVRSSLGQIFAPEWRTAFTTGDAPLSAAVSQPRKDLSILRG